MSKTPMQELKEDVQTLFDNEHITGFTKRAYAKCLDYIEHYETKERQVIEEAFDDGIDNECLGCNVQGDEYYTTKYGKL